MKVLLILLLLIQPVFAGPPPFHNKEPATQENFLDIYRQMATHNHEDNGSTRLETAPIQATAIRGTITPKWEGQQIWDLTEHVTCVSTGTDTNSWTLLHSTTTACPH